MYILSNIQIDMIETIIILICSGLATWYFVSNKEGFLKLANDDLDKVLSTYIIGFGSVGICWYIYTII